MNENGEQVDELDRSPVGPLPVIFVLGDRKT